MRTSLLILLMLVALAPGRGQAAPCPHRPTDPDCALVNLVAVGLVLQQVWAAGGLVPDGAGAAPPPLAPAQCNVTPSTGQGSGVFVRSMPDANAPVIGDLPLGEFRPVSAISADWYQTLTRDSRTGFVAAPVTTLVGACGGVPTFVTTP